jgi:hypothetical protein
VKFVVLIALVLIATPEPVVALSSRPVTIAPHGVVSFQRLTFRWVPLTGASAYLIWVEDIAGVRVVYQWYSATDAACGELADWCSATIDYDFQEGPATWWVKAVDESGDGVWSVRTSFSVEMAPPKPPSTLLPKGENPGLRPYFSWSSVSNATWYRLEIRRQTDSFLTRWYTSAVARCGGPAVSCWVAPDVAFQSGEMTWRVQGWNDHGYGGWSGWTTATLIDDFRAAAPRSVAPVDVHTTSHPTMRWRAIPGATWYWLWVEAPDGSARTEWADARESGCARGTNLCDHLLAMALAEGPLRWWVRPWRRSEWGQWSPAANFTVLHDVNVWAGSVCTPQDATSLDVALWQQTMTPYLNSDLWIDRDAYDAGHYLMVPLHAAFHLNQPAWQLEFRDHIDRFLSAPSGTFASSLLSQVHYLYFASRLAVLSTRAGQSIPGALESLLETFVEDQWTRLPAWRREGGYYPNARERVMATFTSDDWSVKAHNALIDDDYFVFAIAADLKVVRRLRQMPSNPVLDDILTVAERAIRARVVWNERAGWLLEPGVMEDHPDYLFAGHPEKTPGVHPLPVPGIATDSSHAHRWPLMLYSLTAAADGGSSRQFFESLQKGLERQFAEVVIVPPDAGVPAWRTRNYMDGRNGLYRWEPATDSGIGPFGLSDVIPAGGWWSFLGSERMQHAFGDQASRFPLAPSITQVYAATSSRDVHPLLRSPEYLSNGLAELHTRLAARLCLQ